MKTNLMKWKKLSNEYKQYSVQLRIVPVKDVFHTTYRTCADSVTENEEDMKIIRRYAEAMRQSKMFPIIDVYLMSDERFRIIDGNHRFAAWKLLGNKMIPVAIFR